MRMSQYIIVFFGFFMGVLVRPRAPARVRRIRLPAAAQRAPHGPGLTGARARAAGHHPAQDRPVARARPAPAPGRRPARPACARAALTPGRARAGTSTCSWACCSARRSAPLRSAWCAPRSPPCALGGGRAPGCRMLRFGPRRSRTLYHKGRGAARGRTHSARPAPDAREPAARRYGASAPLRAPSPARWSAWRPPSARGSATPRPTTAT